MEHLSELGKVIALVIYDERHINLGAIQSLSSEVLITFSPINSVFPDFSCASIIISVVYCGILSYNTICIPNFLTTEVNESDKSRKYLGFLLSGHLIN